jgi:L-seryl-tRNA(Ser) seleniumtransferase
VDVPVAEGKGRVGAGTYPEHDLPSWTVRVSGGPAGPDSLCRALRLGEPSIVARVEEDTLVLDCRTVREEEAAAVADGLSAVLIQGADGAHPQG